ncbi:beta-lactamase superfamily II metal-dependent hydrolase [Saonia flava]|uniref:Beta-lactamase superfamily II metal-dependent hydrolase n=1 Tax=Saonia flava TaxID=523696 RepID=A0A846QYQ7_9FLAO|nr:MBL fold metallo-hydrolase [Saonia flava]NJB71343.1 beta-lactamase superfamily II metal-dependent hydrolase [Saonia flava]
MFLKRIVTYCLFSFISVSLLFSQEEFPAWEEGVMEIHHINTGRGDAAFFILPDGTTLLVDAGDTSETHPRTLSARNVTLTPNRTKSAPEWIVDYIHQFFPKDKPVQLDYAMLTHYHDDHFGELDSTRVLFKKGNYYLTGITEVGHHIPIKMLLDRGTNFPLNLKNTSVQERLNKNDAYGMIPSLKNYWAFINYQNKENGLVNEPLKAGSKNQMTLKNMPGKYPGFSVQNISVNGKIWTGEKEEYFSLFKEGEYPGENPLSTCIKISYGEFDYFTGGDISGVNALGDSDFKTVEANIAPVAGPVDVATLNHHGNRDSQNAFYVRTLRPRVWIGQTWSSDHPDNNVLRRLLSKELYPGERDLFSTAMLQANKDVIGGLINRYKSLHGHIVVRVYEKGAKYDVFVLNDESEKREVLKKYGPYESR